MKFKINFFKIFRLSYYKKYFIYILLLFYLFSILSCHQPLQNSFSIVNPKTILVGNSANSTIANKCIIDKNNDIIVVGTSDGVLYGYGLIGTKDVFVLKYDSNLNEPPLVVKRFNCESSNISVSSIIADSKGNYFICGITQGNFNFQNKIGFQDIFILKLDESLNPIFTKIIGSPNGFLHASDIKIESYDNIYITGYTYNSFNGQIINGIQDGFLIKLDNNGNLLWTRIFGVKNSETYGNEMTIDNNNYIYITGSTKGNLNDKIKNGYEDLFLIKYDQNGNQIFTILNGAPNSNTWGINILSDNKGNIYVFGGTTGNLNGISKKGLIDTVILKYTDSGTRIFTISLGGNSSILLPKTISKSKLGFLFLGGTFEGNIIETQFGTITLKGNRDLFIIIFSSEGNFKDIKVLEQPNAILELNTLLFDRFDNLLILGNSNNGYRNFPKIGNIDFFLTNEINLK
ncbi:MAG: SBBP repeat-containing protein [Spirochaetes bacterium]|nr:SBBP repeat-containing protein [Spirochaetota bacterium]